MLTRALLISLTCLSLGASAMAAETFPLSVGPYLMFKAGTNAGTIPTGTKTGVVFNGIPDLGAKLFVPFVKDKNIGAAIDIGYHTYAYLTKPNDGATDDNSLQTKFHVLAVSADFVAAAFTVGFTFGFSPSATISNISGTNSSDAKTSDLNSLSTDIHVGAMLPIIATANGRLDFLLRGSYMLSDIAANPTSGSSIHVASVALGFDYLFSLQK